MIIPVHLVIHYTWERGICYLSLQFPIIGRIQNKITETKTIVSKCGKNSVEAASIRSSWANLIKQEKALADMSSFQNPKLKRASGIL